MTSQQKMFETESESIFQIRINSDHPFLKHHVVSDLRVLPGVVYLKIAYIFANKLYPFADFNCMKNISWVAPLVCTGSHVEMNLHMKKIPEGIVFSFKNYLGKKYSSGTLDCKKNPSSGIQTDYESFSHDSIVPRKVAYDEFDRLGISYGPFFRCLNDMKIKNNWGMAEINSESHVLEFVNLLDCAFQSGMAISLYDNFENLMPISLGSLTFYCGINIAADDRYFALTEKVNKFRTNIIVTDNRNNIIMVINDLGIKPGKF
jgi:hypothetical protein